MMTLAEKIAQYWRAVELLGEANAARREALKPCRRIGKEIREGVPFLREAKGRVTFFVDNVEYEFEPIGSILRFVKQPNRNVFDPEMELIGPDEQPEKPSQTDDQLPA